MKSDCDRFEPMLTRALDSELTEPERTELDRHLADCAACRDELEGLRGLRGFMREPPAVPSEAADRTAILAEARRRVARHEGWFERIRCWMTPADWVTAAAVATSVFLGVLLIGGSKEVAMRSGLTASTPVYTVAEYRARSAGRTLERQESFRLDPIPEAGSIDLEEISS